MIVKIVGEESFSFSIGDGEQTKRKRNGLRSTGYIWLGGRDTDTAVDMPRDMLEGEIRNFRVKGRLASI